MANVPYNHKAIEKKWRENWEQNPVNVKENKDGSRTCVRETWYYNEGMIHLDGPIIGGKRNGEFKTYYKSGELMSKGTFVDGIREGEAFTYYENGNIKYYGMYKNGKECGIWKFYYENGELDHETNRDLR